MSFFREQNAKTAYGAAKSESETFVTQISAEYGLLGQVLTVNDILASGSNSVVDDQFTCQSGTDPAGLASITSLRQINYRSGQGAIARISGKFSLGVALNQQLAGLISAENTFAFGFNQTNFGILHNHGGKTESQELTITTPAAGAETATIDINGIPITVPLTAGTVQHNAFEISNSLNAQVNNYNFTSNDDQVVAQAVVPAAQGAFTFSSTGAAVAAWVQTTIGLSPELDFIAQADWNVDTRLTGNTDSDPDHVLDPTKGNEYQVQYKWGFGAIKFFIEDNRTGDLILVHVIRYANKNIIPSVTNPSFRVGWVTFNFGNTTNITISGAEADLTVEGAINRSTPPRTTANNQLAVGATLTNIITFRNRINFGGKTNRVDVLPLLMTLSTQSNKSAFFEIRVNPTFGGDLDFTYIDKDNSIIEVATDAVPVSGGRLLGAATVVAASSFPLQFNTRETIELAALPGQIFTIAAKVSSGAAADMQATGTSVESI